MQQVVPVDQLGEYVGRDLDPSEWFAIDQERIDAFADATLDHQFIHVDPERAKLTPWGTTIAHGYLTLSLLPHLLSDCGVRPEGTVMAVNYGSNKLRFLQPVKVGSRVRAGIRLLEATERAPGQWLLTTAVTVEIEGEEKPAMVAETLSLFVVQ